MSAAIGVIAAIVTVVLAFFVAGNRHVASPKPASAAGAATARAAGAPGAAGAGEPNPGASAGGPCPVPTTATPSGQMPDTVTREQAIQIAQQHVGGKADAARAQLMTLAEYAAGAGNEPLPGKGPQLGGIARDDLVWVVSMTGSFGPNPAGGADTWAVVLIDAVTGAVVGSEDRPREPAFFSDLPDRTRHERPSC